MPEHVSPLFFQWMIQLPDSELSERSSVYWRLVEFTNNLINILHLMHHLSKKLLAVMLSLLLGLSPLQGAIAGYAAFDDQSENGYQLVSLHDNMAMAVNQHTLDQDQCETDTGSTGHSCSSGHCASCALVIAQVSILSTIDISKPLLLQVDDRVVSQPSTSLFRPPKS